MIFPARHGEYRFRTLRTAQLRDRRIVSKLRDRLLFLALSDVHNEIACLQTGFQRRRIGHDADDFDYAVLRVVDDVDADAGHLALHVVHEIGKAFGGIVRGIIVTGSGNIPGSHHVEKLVVVQLADIVVAENVVDVADLFFQPRHEIGRAGCIRCGGVRAPAFQIRFCDHGNRVLGVLLFITVVQKKVGRLKRDNAADQGNGSAGADRYFLRHMWCYPRVRKAFPIRGLS